VKIAQRTESQIVVEGLPEGTVVALVNPEEQAKKPAQMVGPAAPPVGGGSR